MSSDVLDRKQETRFWLLYRRERRKFAPDNRLVRDVEIVRAAREARRVLELERKKP